MRCGAGRDTRYAEEKGADQATISSKEISVDEQFSCTLGGAAKSLYSCEDPGSGEQ